MSDALQRQADAEAAQQAWQRFVAPALDLIRADYMGKLTEFAERPMEGRSLQVVQNMSIALRVTREVENQIKALILDGQAAGEEVDRAGKLARMGAEERRYATY